jgi:hypothetical protein
MKTKRLLHGFLPLLMASLSYTGSALAAPAWYTCTIDTIGSEAIKEGGRGPQQPVVVLDEIGGTFLDQSFIFGTKGRAQSQMVAIALTAASSGFEIEILTDFDAKGSPPKIVSIRLVVGP